MHIRLGEYIWREKTAARREQAVVLCRRSPGDRIEVSSGLYIK